MYDALGLKNRQGHRQEQEKNPLEVAARGKPSTRTREKSFRGCCKREATDKNKGKIL